MALMPTPPHPRESKTSEPLLSRPQARPLLPPSLRQPQVGGGCAALGLVVTAAAIENTMTFAMFCVESLAAERLSGNAGVSTLPTTARLLGASLAAAPASFLMGRAGRRAGFAVGACLAVLGALLCAAAVHLHSFPLQLVGSVVNGAEGGFGGFLRFAAAEVVSRRHKDEEPRLLPTHPSPSLFRRCRSASACCLSAGARLPPVSCRVFISAPCPSRSAPPNNLCARARACVVWRLRPWACT